MRRSGGVAEMEDPTMTRIPQPTRTREEDGYGEGDARRQHKREDPTCARVFTYAIIVATEARGMGREKEAAGMCK
jgi:hypothetical protein